MQDPFSSGDPSEKKEKKAAGVEHNFAVSKSKSWGKLSRQQKKHTRNRIQSKKSKPVWRQVDDSDHQGITWGINESEQSWNMIFLYCYSTVFKSQCSSLKTGTCSPSESPCSFGGELELDPKRLGGRKIKSQCPKTWLQV